MALRASLLEQTLPQEINYNDISFDKALSAGAQGETFLGSYKGEQVVIKKYIHKDQKSQSQLHFEWEALKATFPSEYVVKPIGYCQHPPTLLLEYVENGSLDNFMLTHTLTFNQLMVIVNDTALGILTLLNTGRVHRDIKTANILITKQLRAKICDFDTARNKDISPDEKFEFKGTPFNCAPEYYYHSNFKIKRDGLPATDVFSFGTVLIDLFVDHNSFLFQKFENEYGVKSFKPYSQSAAKDKIEQLHRIVQQSCFNVPDRWISYIKAIILSCIEEDPRCRPSMEVIQSKLQHILDVIPEEKRIQHAQVFAKRAEVAALQAANAAKLAEEKANQAVKIVRPKLDFMSQLRLKKATANAQKAAEIAANAASQAHKAEIKAHSAAAVAQAVSEFEADKIVNEQRDAAASPTYTISTLFRPCPEHKNSTIFHHIFGKEPSKTKKI